jgi:hypothetical protein
MQHFSMMFGAIAFRHPMSGDLKAFCVLAITGHFKIIVGEVSRYRIRSVLEHHRRLLFVYSIFPLTLLGGLHQLERAHNEDWREEIVVAD